ncbi:glucose-6-phosphate isomerase [Phytophthora cinnamomi]|uniref:glucose-6-phosphate isomerase n=1 Tax=Phytophthora cinnamomi TaxID=4785 RepID=UPI00355A51AA|nr:glucose-6-phosphate isomerase [Phytophthora cinnamomi]
MEELSSSYLDARNQTTEVLLLTGAETITDAGLASIALAVPKLKELGIAGAVRITDAALRVLGEYCYGAPFFYNQVNDEIRWRLPRDLLSLTVRPACAQCETPQSASFECATCSEFFCDHCDVVVHGGGKRRLHNKRKLFDFYGRRRDYGDGEFPSIWPSEILQDAARGYDFENLVPRDNYQDMLWEISRFVPVSTGNWDDELAAAEAAASPAVALAFATMLSEGVSTKLNDSSVTTADSDGLGRPSGPKNHLLYREKDFDENGVSLWESFYDYGQGEYRYYHRISKRVVSQLPDQTQQ